MKTRSSQLCAALVAALALMAFSAPAAATWWSTSVSPLVFEFGDNTDNVFDNPLYTIPASCYKTYANAPYGAMYSDWLFTDGNG